MYTRRQILRAGLGLFAYGSAGGIFGAGRRPPRAVDWTLKSSRPLAPRAWDPKPRMIGGFPIKSWFEGDDFNDGLNIPFHSAENNFPGGEPPTPDEVVQVVVVGGGISGLATAYLLRQYHPVVFELHSRFGGNAQGGTLSGAEYPLGSAYVITPDPGGALDTLYRQIGLHEVVRPDVLAAPVEFDGQINPDIWSGMGVPPEDVPIYEAYRQLVLRMADEEYPDVPFAEPWMRELDRITLKAHIEGELGQPLPTPLAAAIQAYCYSSFNAGWEEISAASGWNFLAAEEYGRWIFPGGNAWMADAFWQRLVPLDAMDPAHAPHLRANARVVDVRVLTSGMTQVTWRTPEGLFRSLLAERVVMACPKHVCRQVIHELEAIDPAKFNAMNMQRRPYVVANVVLDRAIERDFYDIFLVGDAESFPFNTAQASRFWRYTDALDGSYASRTDVLPHGFSILSLYWPLPYDTARFDLVLGDPILAFGEALARHLPETLDLLGVPCSAVREVRLARWGHALPIARVGFIADGTPEELIRPYLGRVYFVNQDNWALPAVENSLFDAFNAAEAIASDLG